MFVSYGLQDMRAAEYWSKDSLDVRVELYRYSRHENAFGVYSQERSPEFTFIEIGTQGYMEEGLLNFLCGLYYAKISTHRSGGEAKNAMLNVAKVIVEHLQQATGWPAMIRLLPSEGRLANSETFVLENFLGYSFMRSAWTARYEADKGPLAFVLDCVTSDDAGRTLRQYLQVVNAGESTAVNGLFNIVDPNHGWVGLVVRGRFLAGVVRAPDDLVRTKILKAFDEKPTEALETR